MDYKIVLAKIECRANPQAHHLNQCQYCQFSQPKIDAGGEDLKMNGPFQNTTL